MLEKFNNKAIEVLVLAREESLRCGLNYVAPEQLLVGLIGAQDGLSFSTLTNIGLTLDLARAEVAKSVSGCVEVTDIEVPFTDSAKQVMELALDESRKLGKTEISTEHLLLGLLKAEDKVVESVLENLGADRVRLQRHLQVRIAEINS
jgi:ATP-dependent Clp protease ATP-binding subunit ClpC